MLTKAIRASIQAESENLATKGGLEGPKLVDQLLLGLVRKPKNKLTTNRESRTIIADLFDVEKLAEIRDVFVSKNRSEKTSEELTIHNEDFKNGLSKFVSLKEVELIHSMIDVNESGIISWNNLVNFLIAIESSNRQSEGDYSHKVYTSSSHNYLLFLIQ
jgi:hypothetical protein